MKVRSTTLIVALAASPLCAWAQSAQLYSLTDLGTLGGNESFGYAVSSTGQVAGYALTPGGAIHAFLYSDGMMQDLGTLGGSFSFGLGINSNGQVAGYSANASGFSRAFLYSNGTMQDIGTLGGAFSFGYAVNSGGQVTGSSYTAGSFAHAFLYSDGAMEDLGTLGGTFSAGNGINSVGQVTGYAAKADASHHAFLYSNGAMQDLGTLGGTYSIGYAINTAGQVVGDSLIAGNTAAHAFLYSNGTMLDLGTLGGSDSGAQAVNGTGQITGYATTADGEGRAFLYSDGTMTDLNTLIDPASPLAPYVTLFAGVGISDNGLIVANGFDSRASGVHAYVLTPPPPPVQGIADCASIGDVAPLWDGGFQQQTAKPGVFQASFESSEAQPAIMCVENGANGSSAVLAGSVSLNAITVLDTGDLRRGGSGSVEARVNLLEQNALTVRLVGRTGAGIRVRVFKALP